jgi:pimeloyl-ACP methyl ester carboxylesterase
MAVIRRNSVGPATIPWFSVGCSFTPRKFRLSLDMTPKSRLCEERPNVHIFPPATMMQEFEGNGARILYRRITGERGEGDQNSQFIWAHGWGQDGTVFLSLAESMGRAGEHFLIDFPGFGESPPPPDSWGTAEYADAAAELLDSLPRAERRVWIGHSFGCRVGLQLAARHPAAVDGLFLAAAAGLPRRRSPLARLGIATRIALYKSLRALPFTDQVRLRDRFGSADYQAAGKMRPILTKVVNEDLSDIARKIALPTTLLYGAGDTETPPEIGQRLAALIPNANLVLLNDLDHYSILNEGRHQFVFQLQQYLADMASAS